MLAKVRAKRPLENRDLVNIVNNFSCRLGLEKVTVYISYDYPSNVYFMQPLIGGPSLVVGYGITTKLSRKELDALLFSALVRIKQGDARFRTICSLILGVFYFPFYALLLTPLGKVHILGSLVSYLIFPVRILRSLLLSSRRDLGGYDQEVYKLLEDPSNLTSAFFKVSQLNFEKTDSLADIFMEDIALGENKKEDILSSILRSGNNVNKRYLNIER
jgi:Zn-dependent protease with chaperone function